MKKLTLSELSKLTGFSKSTVSRVLNGKADKYRISSDTQELIKYTYSLFHDVNISQGNVAQHLHNNNHMNIGLVVPSISNPFFANLAAAIISEAQKYNYSITTFDSQEDPIMELKILRDVLSRNICGLIIVPVGTCTTDFEIVQKQIPVILVDRYFKKSNLPFIACNNFEGGYTAITQLIKAGHKSILCIEGPKVSITTKERERGAKAALKDSGKECHVFFRGNEFSISNGYLQTRLSKILNPHPTAIFAMSNTILLGCLKAIRELGLSIPENISILSYDDLPYLDYLDPPVTRIAQPLSEIGKAAIKIMVNSIEHNSTIKSQILMSPKLINRKSIKLFY